jgi:hypothetical protein
MREKTMSSVWCTMKSVAWHDVHLLSARCGGLNEGPGLGYS